MKNQHSISYTLVRVSLFFTLLTGYFSFSQNKNIHELNYGNTVTVNNSNRNDFYNLAFKLHPTVYLSNNEIKNVYGASSPIKIKLSDAFSIAILKSLTQKYGDTQLIIITLNNTTNFNTKLDLSFLHEFKKLKYIFIKCMLKDSNDKVDVKNLLKLSPNSTARVFYKTETPS